MTRLNPFEKASYKKQEQRKIKYFEGNASVDRNNSSTTMNQGFAASMCWDTASVLLFQI